MPSPRRLKASGLLLQYPVIDIGGGEFGVNSLLPYFDLAQGP